MKRRSLRGNAGKQSVQSILFNKSSSRTTIIPESPLITSIASYSGKMSVLETPDTASKSYCLQNIIEAEEASDFNSSEDFVHTPNILRDKKKINLRDKGFGFMKSNDKILKSRKTISPSKIIFPFDVNDKEEITRKLNSLKVISSPRNKIDNRAADASPVFKRSSAQSSLKKNNILVKEKICKALDILNSSNQALNPGGYFFGQEMPSEDNSSFILEKSPQFDLNPNASCMHSNLPDTQPVSSLILDGIVAYVDVRSGNDNRSVAIKEFAESIGAEIASKFTSRVTHLIFKEGSKSTFDRAIQKGVHMVSTLWLDACHSEGTRLPESLYPAISSNTKNTILPVKYRKPRSMQPLPFEEQEQLANARIRKKLKSSKCSTISEGSTSNTPLRVQELQLMSPRQALKNFLSPRSERSSSSTENSAESDEDMNTPLRERMYQKIFKERVPLSPLTITSGNRQYHRQRVNQTPDGNKEENRKLFESHGENESSAKRKSATTNFNTSRRRSHRIAQLNEVRCNMSQLFNMSDLRLSLSPGKAAGRFTNFENKDMDITSGDSVFVDDTDCSSIHDQINNNLTKDKSVQHIVTIQRKTKCLQQQEVGSQSNGTFSSTSSFPRKHRLHTVDVDQPTQDLIVPNTPDSPEKIPSSIYDSLMELKSQVPSKLVRNGPKIHIKKLKDHTLFESVSTHSTSNVACEAATDSVVTSSVTMEEKNNAMEVSEAATTSTSNTLPVKCRPRKLSILPKSRNSIEEFVPQSRNKRQSWVSQQSHESTSICFTSVKSCDIPNLMAIVHKLKGYRTVKSVNASTTHVVCGSERRTLNVLRGITKGCWIVDVSWLFESLDLEQWAPEEPFELFNFCPGAKISRLAKMDDSLNEKGLLCDIGNICISGTTDPPPADLKTILKNLGANVITTTQHADVIIGRKLSDRNPTAMYVHEKWLLDCVQHWKTFPPDGYKINCN